MRLTVYTDYALRLLMYLALKEDGLATIAEVAEAYQISKNHLMKVAYELGVAGDIETVRGRNGGLKLSRSVDAIVIGDVVRRTEPDMALVPCFSAANESCAVRPSCVIPAFGCSSAFAFCSRARARSFGLAAANEASS